MPCLTATDAASSKLPVFARAQLVAQSRIIENRHPFDLADQPLNDASASRMA